MSMIRISMLEDGLYAPGASGEIDIEPFSLRKGADNRGRGRMPLYPRGVRPKPRDDFWAYLERSLAHEAKALPANAPVVALVHGFQFEPAMPVITPPHHDKAENPHARLYHFHEYDYGSGDLAIAMRAHSTSWPLGLGVRDRDAGASGLCLGFAWDSYPDFFGSLFRHGRNFYARAYEVAETAAWQLLCALEVAATVLDRRIDLFAHSLGTRVVVRALADALSPLPGNRAMLEYDDPTLWTVRPVLRHVDRVLLLAGAERVMEAQLLMARINSWSEKTGGADGLQFYNVVSRENDVLDKLGENLGPASPGSKQVIGHNGLEKRDPRWLDLQLDDEAVAEWFATAPRDYRVSGDNRSVFAVMDHWIHYTWPDNMRVYHDILRSRAAWRIADIKRDRPALFDRIRINRGPGAD